MNGACYGFLQDDFYTGLIIQFISQVDFNDE